MSVNGLELKLYYTRNEYPYQVRYLEQGTGEELHAPKNDKGKYQQVISEEALDIDDYVLVSESPATLNIRIEEDDEAKLNVITFYYKQKEATINYIAVGPEGLDAATGAPNPTVAGSVLPEEETVKILTGAAQGSTAAANTPGYRFVGWYDNSQCTGVPLSTDEKFVPTRPGSTIVDGVVTGGRWSQPSYTYYAKFEAATGSLIIKKTGLQDTEKAIFKVTVKNGSETAVYTVTLGNNQMVTIADLPVNAIYEVEEENWSWSYNKLDKQTGTIQGGGTSQLVEFENSKNEKWLYDEHYVENVFSSSGN